MFIMHVTGQPQIPQGSDTKESSSTSEVDNLEGNKVEVAIEEHVIERQGEFINT